MRVEFEQVGANGIGLLYDVFLENGVVFRTTNPESDTIKRLKASGYRGLVAFYRVGKETLCSTATIP